MPAISQLPAATEVNNGDLFVIVQTGVTKQASDSLVLASIQATIQISESQVTNLTSDLAARLISANNLSDLTSAPAARNNLGLGTMATQSASDYLLLAGGTMTGNLILNGDPTTSNQAANKNYVDNAITGLTVQGACEAGTTAVLNAVYFNGSSGVGATLTNAGALAAFQVDGYSASLNDRILVKDQAVPAQNGIYTVTTLGSGAVEWVLTRATDYDTPTQINPGDLVIIINGTANTNTSWMQTGTVTTIGTDAITFIQFTAALPISVPNGGTGRTTSTTAYALIAAGTTATGALQTLSTGSTGQILQSNGAAALPNYSTATYPSIATSSGRLLRADGTNWVQSTSTFSDTYSASNILYSNGANTVTGLATANSASLVTNSSGVPVWTSTMTNGQLTIGSTGSTPSNTTLTAGNGIAITNGAGSITIAVTGGGMSWTEVTSTSQSMSTDSGYIANNAGLVTLTLPVTAALGTSVSVCGKGAGGWLIAQNSGQSIRLGSSTSTVGVGGSLASTNAGDSINLLCTTANTVWTAIGAPQGIITVV